jgi:toxin ParE1/3/4
MGLKIYWTDFSKNELHRIFDYYKLKASVRISRKLINGIVQSVDILKDQPLIGQVEELLLDREQDFRYLVYKNYKLIYWINTQKTESKLLMYLILDKIRRK